MMAEHKTNWTQKNNFLFLLWPGHVLFYFLTDVLTWRFWSSTIAKQKSGKFWRSQGLGGIENIAIIQHFSALTLGILKAPPVNPWTYTFSVLQCKCLTYQDYSIFVDLFYREYTIVNLLPIFRAFSNIFKNILTPLSRTYLGSPRNIVPRINRGCF